MASSPVTERTISTARNCLATFVCEKASEAAHRVGFGWVASPRAPETYGGLLTEFTECMVSGRNMRVGTVNAIPSVFGSARATFAMGFWHDVSHVEMDADLGFLGEMRVAKAHLTEVAKGGMPEGSLSWHLMRAATVGQNYVKAMTEGGLVPDRLAFAMTAVQNGLPMAVLDAVQQIEGRSINGRDTEALLRYMRVEA